MKNKVFGGVSVWKLTICWIRGKDAWIADLPPYTLTPAVVDQVEVFRSFSFSLLILLFLVEGKAYG